MKAPTEDGVKIKKKTKKNSTLSFVYPKKYF
jgi:hypothetical protein